MEDEEIDRLTKRSDELIQQSKELIDKSVIVSLLSRRKVQYAFDDGHASIGRNDIDLVGAYTHSILDRRNAPPGRFGEEFGQNTLMRWIKMLHQHEAHAGVGRQMS